MARFSKQEVDYRVAEDPLQSCANCAFFDEETSTCSRVEGAIDPEWTCDLWQGARGGDLSMLDLVIP